MDTVDINYLTNSDNYIITQDLSRPELYEVTGKNRLCKLVSDKLGVILFSLGLDEYLIKIGSFKGSDYKRHIQRFRNKYFDESIPLSESTYLRAYQFLKDELDKNNIYYVDDQYQVFEVDEPSTSHAICRIVENSLDSLDKKEYRDLIGFVNYMISQEERKVIGGRK